MHPILIDFAGITVSSYAVTLAAALVVAMTLAVREAERRQVPVNYFLAVGLLLGGMVGARAFWIVQYGELHDVWRAVFVWSPGMVLYGGVLGGLVTLLVHHRIRRLPLLPSMDVLAPHVALGEAIARIGCFLAGCCWGRICSMPWGVQFPAGSYPYGDQFDAGLLDAVAQHSLPIHPTQLYMAAGLVAGFILLRRTLHRQHPQGWIVASYFAYYGALRFAVDAFRGDGARPFLGMTVSQAISVALFLGGIAGLAGIRWNDRSRRDERHSVEES
jgi:phosphatidylglycerol:prolipoprotein diacylglycerol transferase